MLLHLSRFLQLLIVLSVVFCGARADTTTEEIPEYVKQCSTSNPELKKCLLEALHHLRPYLTAGIPEIQLPAIEPFHMDELTLKLGSGPQGYQIQLRNMSVRGASNYTVEDIKLGSTFAAAVRIPRLVIDAPYTSSGVLISIIRASGNGSFHAEFGRIRAVVTGNLSTMSRNGKTFMHLDKLNINLNITDLDMQIEKIYKKNNEVFKNVINLFLKEHGRVVLEAMEPLLKKKLSTHFTKIVNQLLTHVPIELFLIP